MEGIDRDVDALHPNATHGSSFPPRLTDVQAFIIPIDRHRKDGTPTLRECLQDVHTMVHT